MELSKLKPAKGSVKSRKRIARGVGSGHGNTATRGHKGAKSRSGYSQKRAFEGGQMPLQMRLPKRGFKNSHRRYKSYRPANYVTLNLSMLEKLASKHNLSSIDFDTLYDLGIVGKSDSIKVLANGELKQALQVSADRFSAAAKKAIRAAGGEAFTALKLNQVQGVAHADKLSKVDLAAVRKHFDYIGEDDKLHVTAEGSLSTKFDLVVHKISSEAQELVEKNGGSVSIA